MKPYAEWGDWSNLPLRVWPWSWFVGTPEEWRVLYRCTKCGRGLPLAGSKWPFHGSGRAIHSALLDGEIWLCAQCGAPLTSVTKWIGRCYAGSPHFLVEWMPLDRMPLNMRPKDAVSEFDRAVAEAVERELPKRLDAEFEARVKAAVEVELATRGLT